MKYYSYRVILLPCFIFTLIMNINDESVLDMLNNIIASERFNKKQILQMVGLVLISNDYIDLKDNLKWETYNSLYKYQKER